MRIPVSVVIFSALLAWGSAQSPGGQALAEQEFLERHGIEAVHPVAIIAELEARERAPLPYMASVTSGALILADADAELIYDLSTFGFYLAVAPFVDQTHACFNHSLATCQGELHRQEFEVVVTAEDGSVYRETTLMSGANGFIGLWLPHDGVFTVTVSARGYSGSQLVSTGADAPTCLTTLQLRRL